MQKKYLTLFILFLSIAATSQDFERVWELGRRSKVELIKYCELDNSWIIVGSKEAQTDGNIFINKMDTLGNILWEAYLSTSYGLRKAFDVEINSLGEIYVVSKNNDGCYHMGDLNWLVGRFNKDGTLISYIEYPHSTDFKDMHLFNDTLIAFATGNSIQVLDTLYNSLWIKNVSILAAQKCLGKTMNGELIVFGDSIIWKLDPLTGSTIDSISISSPISHMVQKDEWFYLMNPSRLILKMDDALSISSDTFAITHPFGDIQDWKILPNGNSVMLGKAHNFNQLQILDTNFVLSYSRIFYKEHAFISSFEVANQKLLVGGSVFSEFSDFFYHGFDDYNGDAMGGFANYFLKELDFTLFSNDLVNDAEILDFSADSIRFTLVDCYYGGGDPRFSFMVPKVTIKNKGNIPITDLNIYIGRYLSCFPFHGCAETYQRADEFQLLNLNIPPGATEDVILPDYSTIETYRLGIYVRSVNRRLDNDCSDNSLSVTLDPSDLNNGGGQNSGGQNIDSLVTFYPSPAQHYIIFSASEDIKFLDYQIYNATGQLVQSQTNLEINSKLHINIDNLHTGYYILKAQTDLGSEIIEPLIKHE